MTRKSPENLIARVQQLNADIASELVDKAALKEALAIPADQLEADLVAEGVDLEGGARRFREMLQESDAGSSEYISSRELNVVAAATSAQVPIEQPPEAIRLQTSTIANYPRRQLLQQPHGHEWRSRAPSLQARLNWRVQAERKVLGGSLNLTPHVAVLKLDESYLQQLPWSNGVVRIKASPVAGGGTTGHTRILAVADLNAEYPIRDRGLHKVRDLRLRFYDASGELSWDTLLSINERFQNKEFNIGLNQIESWNLSYEFS
jgi:hypothetical protein